jgi:hypothetical protein
MFASSPSIHRVYHSFLLDLGKFVVPEEFPIEQLYDVYMQKHAMDDLVFAIEFKVDG